MVQSVVCGYLGDGFTDIQLSAGDWVMGLWVLNKEEGYLLPTIARKITCQRFDRMLQSSSGRKSASSP